MPTRGTAAMGLGQERTLRRSHTTIARGGVFDGPSIKPPSAHSSAADAHLDALRSLEGACPFDSYGTDGFSVEFPRSNQPQHAAEPPFHTAPVIDVSIPCASVLSPAHPRTPQRTGFKPASVSPARKRKESTAPTVVCDTAGIEGLDRLATYCKRELVRPIAELTLVYVEAARHAEMNGFAAPAFAIPEDLGDFAAATFARPASVAVTPVSKPLASLPQRSSSVRLPSLSLSLADPATSTRAVYAPTPRRGPSSPIKREESFFVPKMRPRPTVSQLFRRRPGAERNEGREREPSHQYHDVQRESSELGDG